MLSLIAIICFFTICIMFAKEFGNMFKKILKVPGLKLLLPLGLLTILWVAYEPYVLTALLYTKWALVTAINWLASWLPFSVGALVLVATPILLLICLLPSYLLNRLSLKRNRHVFYYAGFLTAVLWLFLVIVLLA